MKQIKLFCLPHAGGFAMYYNQWKRYVDKSIKIIPVELTGRGRRIKEPFYNNFNEAVSDLFNEINMELDGSEFAFFGHSMGSTLAYELTYKIKEMKNQEPINLFLSGRYPPHIRKNKDKLHLLSDKDFTKEIIKYGGMPAEVVKEKKLMEMVIPILKADFKILDSYEYTKKDNKLNCEISVLVGKDDNGAKIEELKEWNEHTNSGCNIFQFDGGHFYVNDNIEKITNIINWKLAGELKQD